MAEVTESEQKLLIALQEIIDLVDKCIDKKAQLEQKNMLALVLAEIARRAIKSRAEQ